MIKEMAEALMRAEAEALCGAAHGERSPERVNQHNGYHERPLGLPRWLDRPGDPQAPQRLLLSGLAAGAAPAGRAGPGLGGRRHMYLAGVSTRRVDKVIRQLGVDGMSKSQVSRLAASLDEIVAEWRTRPLQNGPYAFLMFALVVKVREAAVR